MALTQNDRLATEPVGRLMFSLAIPAILSQIINLLYNMVDRVFIGHISSVGADALTGVGVCSPLIILIAAFASLAAMGGAPRTAIFLGKGDKETAENILGNCAFLLIILSIVLTVFFQIFGYRFLLVFGASENTIGYAWSYLKIYTLGTIFVQMTLGLNAFISTQGFAKISMYTVTIGAVLNILLDPVFIFVLKMGVQGAALATIISQCVSMVWTIVFLTGNKTNLKIKKQYLKLDGSIIGPCVLLGLAPFIMQSTESILFTCFNSSLLKYGGDIAVGAMTILTTVSQMAMLPLVGLAHGAQPIISYNLGSKNYGRMKSAFKILLLCSLAYTLTLWTFIELFPAAFAKIFSNDATLVDFTAHSMRIYLAMIGLMGIQMACQQTFVAIGNAKCSIFVALLRKVILLIPLIYILPAFMVDKTTAIFLAEPLADLVSISTAGTLFYFEFKKIIRQETTHAS